MEEKTKPQARTRDLGKGSIPKLLAQLAIPVVVAQIVNLLYNIVDRIYIGHIPKTGSLALTGLGVCMPIIMIISAFAALIGFGGAPRASIFMGKGENDSAEKTLGNCFTTQIIISIILTIVLLFGNRFFLMAFGASDNTIDFATSYMNIYALGTIFVQLTLGMNSFVTAQGFSKTGMLTVVIGAVCNIILDPIFIFVLGLGVKGAAIATIISQGVSCIWVISFLTGRKTFLKIKKKYLMPSADVILPCMALGVSTFVMQASESVISVCFNSSLLKYGGDVAVGAMTILTSVMQFAMLPLQGIGQGAQPVTSYNYGAKNTDRVKKTFKILITVSLSYSVVFWALIQMFPSVFAGIFSSDKSLVTFTADALKIYCGMLFMFGIQIACQMTFVAIGNAICSVIVAVVRKFVLLLPLIYIVPNFVSNKTNGVYMAEPIADFIAVSFTVIIFLVQFKKALRKLKEI